MVVPKPKAGVAAEVLCEAAGTPNVGKPACVDAAGAPNVGNPGGALFEQKVIDQTKFTEQKIVFSYLVVVFKPNENAGAAVVANGREGKDILSFFYAIFSNCFDVVLFITKYYLFWLKRNENRFRFHNRYPESRFLFVLLHATQTSVFIRFRFTICVN